MTTTTVPERTGAHRAQRAQRPGRITGLDLARALAILGMMFTHILYYSTIDPLKFLTNGYPSTLFAVLSGISLSLMLAHGNEHGGTTLSRARHSVLIRAAIIFGIGIVLDYVQHQIAVVLMAIATNLILLTPITRLRTRWVAAATALTLFIAPFISIGGQYPIGAWLTYGLIGILTYRTITTARLRTTATVAASTIIIAALTGWIRIQQHYDWVRTAASLGWEQPGYFTLDGAYLTTWAHKGGIGDIIATGSASAALILLCVLICRLRWASILTYPLRALGMMALTTYTIHVILTGAIAPAIGYIDMHHSQFGYDTYYPSDMGPIYGIEEAGAMGIAAELGIEPQDLEDPNFDISSYYLGDWQPWRDRIANTTTWSEAEDIWYEAHLAPFKEDGTFNSSPADPGPQPYGEDYYDPSADRAEEQRGWSPRELLGFAPQSALIILLASTWMFFFRRGPLEWLVQLACSRGSRTDLPPLTRD